jgi:hypothetical protein
VVGAQRRRAVAATRGLIGAGRDGEEGKWSGMVLNLTSRRKASTALHSGLRG